MGIIAMGAHSEMRERRRRRAAIVTAQNPFIVREKFVSSVPPARRRIYRSMLRFYSIMLMLSKVHSKCTNSSSTKKDDRKIGIFQNTPTPN